MLIKDFIEIWDDWDIETVIYDVSSDRKRLMWKGKISDCPFGEQTIEGTTIRDDNTIIIEIYYEFLDEIEQKALFEAQQKEELHAKLLNKISDLEDELNRITKSAKLMKNTIKHKDEKISELEKDKKSLNEALDSKNDIIKNLKNNINEIESDLHELEGWNEQLRENNKDLIRSNLDLLSLISSTSNDSQE